MIYENKEIKKIFNYILTNKHIILSDNFLFSRDTLIELTDILKGKVPNEFELSKQQINVLIDAFINSDFAFDDDTPSFILEDEDCINVAILRDINSANYIYTYTPELEKKVLDLALSRGFILQASSPAFLKANPYSGLTYLLG